MFSRSEIFEVSLFISIRKWDNEFNGFLENFLLEKERSGC
jgi:hypothetical protein